MDPQIKSPAERCWDYLDGIVDEIMTLSARLEVQRTALDADAVREVDGTHLNPPSGILVEPGLPLFTALEAAKERARGAAAVMATIYALKPETISAESGARYAARAAGQPTPYRTDAELRGRYEPLR